MLQEFKMSLGYKITYGILAVGIAALGVFFLTTSSTPGIIVGLITLLAATAFALYIIKRKVIVTSDEIIVNGLFGEKRRLINDIKGFRDKGKAIAIYPAGEQGRKLTINDYDAVNGDEQLKNWLTENLRDLDNEEYEAEKALILQDAELGFTDEERAGRFGKTVTVAAVYSVTGFVLMLIAAIFRTQNIVLSAAFFFYPLGGVILVVTSKGVVRFYAKTNSAYSSIFIGMFFGAIALIADSFSYQILNADKMWSSLIGTVMVLIAVLSWLALKQPNQTFKNQIWAIVLFSAAYGFGATQQINTKLDDSTVQVFPATVSEHYVKHSKGTTYHLVISGWGPHAGEDEIIVSSDFYDQVDVGSSVHVNLKAGKLGIPWYYITL